MSWLREPLILLCDTGRNQDSVGILPSLGANDNVASLVDLAAQRASHKTKRISNSFSLLKYSRDHLITKSNNINYTITKIFSHFDWFSPMIY